MTEILSESVKVVFSDQTDASSDSRLRECLNANDLLNFFRIDGRHVVAVIDMNKKYASLGRTFPAFAKVIVDQGAVVWRLGIDHPEVYLQEVAVRDQSQGIGPRQFAQLARSFAAAQFVRVATFGVRSPHRKQNLPTKDFGYNALPKWGFDGPIPASSKSDLPTSHSQMGDRSIRELLATVGGEQLWKDVGDSCELTFDLNSDSSSWRVLASRLGQDLGSIQGN